MNSYQLLSIVNYLFIAEVHFQARNQKAFVKLLWGKGRAAGKAISVITELVFLLEHKDQAGFLVVSLTLG